MTAVSMDRLPRLAAAFAEAPDRFPKALAAKHERLIRKIDTLWGTGEATRYLDSLMLSDRHDRHGFSDAVIAELVFLKQLHEARFPDVSLDPNDPFAAATTDVVRLDQKEGQRSIVKTHDASGRRATAEEEAAPEVAGEAVPEEERSCTEPLGDLLEPACPWPEVRELDELRQIVEARRQGTPMPAKDTRRLGEILTEHGLVTADDIAAAMQIQKAQGGRHEPIGKILNKMGTVNEENVIRALCQQAGLLMIDLHAFRIEVATMKKVPLDVARAKKAVPVAILEGCLFLAVSDPLSFADREYFAFLTNLNVELVFASSNRLTQRLADYGQARTAREADEEFRVLAKRAFVQLPASAARVTETQAVSQEDSTVVGLVNRMINDAATTGASDIHLESFPGNGFTRIRLRRDGRMEDYSEFPAGYHEAVVSRIKIMADLDISERRKPQDGKVYFVRPGHGRLDLRVATIPTIRGIEDVTIRLLPAGEPMAIDAIGMDARDLKVFRQLIAKPYGLILVCGPTGSGKTTTLHSALRELNTSDKKIWTAEDPVEIVQKNICQVQVNPRIGWTFANALRAFLRADPDIIMIGEMRDQETARIALEASMTGHLVLSTLHTNSASETVARLMDLGVDPFNLADAILGVFAQRLARRLCPACAESVALTATEVDELAAEYYYAAYLRQPSLAEREAIIADWRTRLGHGGTIEAKRPKGCEQCNGGGYKGRVGLYEVLEVTPAIRHLIRTQASATDFLRVAIGDGMSVLKQDGIEKVLMGLTDMTQVRSACI